jgi:hypothetical protein
MKIISRPRGTGKTEMLIRMAAERFLYIVVASQERAYKLAAQARDMGLDIPFPITFGELLDRHLHGPGMREGVLIDQADHLVEHLGMRAGVDIIACTVDAEKVTGEMTAREIIPSKEALIRICHEALAVAKRQRKAVDDGEMITHMLKYIIEGQSAAAKMVRRMGGTR